MGKTALITGVNGFLGGALWKYFKKKQYFHKVFGLDIRPGTTSRRIFICNLNKQKECSNNISRLRPDCIFHLAGGRINSGITSLESNFLATRFLLDSVATIKDYNPRIIIPGSAAEYGNALSSNKPIRESAPIKPASWYGFGKYMQTSLGLMYARDGLDVVVARIFNICGFGMPATLSLGQFSKQIVNIEKGRKKCVIQTGSLEMKRDFLDVEDVCAALLAINQRGKSGEIYNVCSGKPYVMSNLLKKLISYSKADHIAIEEEKINQPGIKVSVGSNVKIKKATGWKPKIDINQSLKNTLKYYRTPLKRAG